MNKDINMCFGGTSIAHTYGNVTSVMMGYIKSLFGEKYFKTQFISSTIAFRQINVLRNRGKEFLKKNKPMLIVRPRIEILEDDKFMSGTLLTERIIDNYDGVDLGNLQNFFYDSENNICIKYLLNRLRISFDVTIVFSTMMEQLNVSQYFKNRVRQNHNFYLNAFLESYVPKDLLEVVSKHSGVPMEDENGKVKPFLDYLNSHSYYPFTYKLQDSTGNDEYFRYYPAKLDTVISNLNIEEGSKKGSVADSYPMTFTITTEFWSTGLYYLFSKQPINYISKAPENSENIIPLYTIDLNTLRAPQGWSIYSSTIYKVDRGVKEDVVDFSKYINETLTATIKFFREKGVPESSFITETIMMDDTFLSKEDGEYKIDYETCTVTTYKISPISTYRLIIYVNTLYLNEAKMKIFDTDNYSKGDIT